MKCKKCGEDTGIRKNLCGKCYAKKYRKEHPEVAIAYNERNKDRIKRKAKEYHKKNRKHLLQLGDEYREEHRQELRDWQKENRTRNRESVLAREKESVKRNIDNIMKRRKERHDKIHFNGLRTKVLKRDGYKCIKCGITHEEHLLKYKISLVVHHIDGNGRNTRKSNNTLDNLQTLCVSCHGKVHGRKKEERT